MLLILPMIQSKPPPPRPPRNLKNLPEIENTIRKSYKKFNNLKFDKLMEKYEEASEKNDPDALALHILYSDKVNKERMKQVKPVNDLFRVLSVLQSKYPQINGKKINYLQLDSFDLQQLRDQASKSDKSLSSHLHALYEIILIKEREKLIKEMQRHNL